MAKKPMPDEALNEQDVFAQFTAQVAPHATDESQEGTNKALTGLLGTTSSKSGADLFDLGWTLGRLERGSQPYSACLSILVPDIPGITIDKERFADALAFSFSLSIDEKRRVLREYVDIGLTQFQVDELVKTFEDERKEFIRLLSTESRHIIGLYFKCIFEWARLVFGGVHDRYWLNELCSRYINGENQFPKSLTQQQPIFNTILCDFMILWGSSTELVGRLLDQSLSDDSGIMPAEAVIDLAYRTRLKDLPNKRAYISHRLNIAEAILIPNIQRANIKARSFIYGICTDHYELGNSVGARAALLSAQSVLDAQVPGTDTEKFGDAQARLYQYNFYISACAGSSQADQALKWLQLLRVEDEDSLTSESVIDGLFYLGQFELAAALLARAITKYPDHKDRDRIILNGYIAASFIKVAGIKQSFAKLLYRSISDEEASKEVRELSTEKERHFVYAVSNLLLQSSGDNTLTESVVEDLRKKSARTGIQGMMLEKLRVPSNVSVDRGRANRLNLVLACMDGEWENPKKSLGRYIEYRAHAFDAAIVFAATKVSNVELRRVCEDGIEAMIDRHRGPLLGLEVTEPLEMLRRISNGEHQGQVWRLADLASELAQKFELKASPPELTSPRRRRKA